MKPERHILLANPAAHPIYATQSSSCAQHRLCHVNFLVLISGLGVGAAEALGGLKSEAACLSPALGSADGAHVSASDIFLGGTLFNRLRRRPVSTWRLRELFPALKPPPPEVLANRLPRHDYSP